MASKTHIFSPPGEGKSLSMGGPGVIYKVLGEDTDGALAVVEYSLEPGRLVRPHTHANEDEISLVVEGHVGVRVGEEEIVAKPGTWVFKPRGISHTFWNPGSKTARVIEIITPGAFAPFFEELERTVNAGGPPEQERLAETARKYGLTYQMELIPALKAKYNMKLTGE